MAAMAGSREWRRLLHYRANGHSQVRGGDFFLSPRGGEDATAELAADLVAMAAPAVAGAPQAQCRFPARYDFLRARFPGATGAPVDCAEFRDWRTKLDA